MRRRKFARFSTYNVRICGEVVDIHVARLRYRCRVCLGELEFYNSGLACVVDKNHNGFIHYQAAEQEQQDRAAQLAAVETVYEIRDGQLAVKEK